MKRANPTGRADLLLLGLAERVTRTRLEPRAGFLLWDYLKPAAESAIKRIGVPKRNLLSDGFGKALRDAIGGRL